MPPHCASGAAAGCARGYDHGRVSRLRHRSAAQYMALMTQAEGIAIVIEKIFENRFMHAQELARMGANIRIEGKQAIVAGPRELTGAGVIASTCGPAPRWCCGPGGQRRDRHRPRVSHRPRL